MYDVVGRYISDRESRSLAGSPLQVQVSVKVPVGAAFLKGLHVGSDVHARYALIECPVSRESGWYREIKPRPSAMRGGAFLVYKSVSKHKQMYACIHICLCFRDDNGNEQAG